MFAYYFACLSNLTPPVAIASYGAAGISGQKPSVVGWTGFRISLAAFLIPFTFVYSPQLLLVQGSVAEIALAVVTSVIGVVAIAAAIQNFLMGPLNIIQRILLFIGAVLLVFPGMMTDGLGIAVTIMVIIWQKVAGTTYSTTIDSQEQEA